MDQKKKSGRHSRWWYLASVAPIALVLIAGLGGGYFLRTEPDIDLIREWAGARPDQNMVSPVKFAIPVKVNRSELLFETEREKQDVVAMMKGEVIEVGQGTVKLAPDGRPDILVYRNLSSVTAHEHDRLKCGDKIGEVKPDNVVQGKVQLRVDLEKETETCPSRENMPAALASNQVAEGRTIYTAICAGCHTIRQTGLLVKNGKLISGDPAIAATMIKKIRKGGGRMPAFDPSVLPTPELCAVTSFLLAKSQ